MTWRMVVINEHCKLTYQNGSLIYKSPTRVEKIHLSEIHTVMIETTDVVFTSALMYMLMENNVKVIFCDDKRTPTCECVRYYGSHDSSRRLSQQLEWQEDYKQYIWTEVIKQKICNQAIVLRNKGKLKEADKLDSYLKEIEPFDASNREGHSAKVYFNALFGKGFTREAETDINAFLDYGYTLLLSTVNREIVKNGVMTQLGLKHSNFFNHFNLSSDLMEPFRPVIDELIYDIQDFSFSLNKHRTFDIFEKKYQYAKGEMYLTNIIEDYVKKVLKCLDEQNIEKVPEFRISEL